jgi:hypothetical protein
MVLYIENYGYFKINMYVQNSTSNSIKKEWLQRETKVTWDRTKRRKKKKKKKWVVDNLFLI